jgi:hypothetical protein
MGTGAGSPPDPDRIVGELHTWMDGVEFTAAEFFDLLKGYDVEDDQSGRDHVFRATRRLGSLDGGLGVERRRNPRSCGGSSSSGGGTRTHNPSINSRMLCH